MSRCAKYLGLSYRQVLRLIDAGRLVIAPVLIHGGADVVTPESLAAELARRGLGTIADRRDACMAATTTEGAN